MMQKTKKPERRWTITDTLSVRRISSVDASRDGKRITFAVTRAVTNDGKDCTLSQVYLSEPSGSSPVPLTSVEFSCFSPQWSPDGCFIACISRNNIWLISLPTMAMQQVTATQTGVSSYKWSPDGSMIAFTSVDTQEPQTGLAIHTENDPRLVGRDVQKQRLWVVSIAEAARNPARGRPLTGGDLHLGAPESPGAYDWSPDCRSIVFSHCRSPRPDDWPTTRLSRLDLDDGSIQSLGPEDHVVWNPYVSPSGEWVACKVYDDPAWEWSSLVHLVPLAGGEAHPLADTHDRRPDVLGWSADASLIYYIETCGTRQRLCGLPADGGAPIVLYEPDGCIENASLNHARSALGFTLQSTTEPPEGCVTPLEIISPLRVSNFNEEIHNIPLGCTDVIRWKSPDGLEIEGLLTCPAAYLEGQRIPLLVSVHGGPANAWTQFFIGSQSFYGPIAAFSSLGYAILRCNVRGSTGYGKAFRQKNFRDWGGKDVQDLLAGVDHVINLGIADPERLAIIGWSYGGYLAAATITQTDRFKAAVIGDGMTDLVSYALGHDSPGFVTSYFGGEVWEVGDLLLERSPIVHADRVTTPTLILHGEDDQRVPLWQGYEFHNALQRCGCPTQMVVYPRTGHTPSTPKMLLDVMRRILSWVEMHVAGQH